MGVRILAVLLAMTLLSGCTDWIFGRKYDSTKTGTLKGKIIVEWIDQDRFIFIPDKDNPLTFTRRNKEVIIPQRMYTDGGSVPAPLRVVKSYSPWGYAPAFIIHDWLFVMKHCKLPGSENYDLEKAATIMAEVLKTIMEKPRYGGPNKLVHYSMYEAVRTSTAKNYWDNGKCDSPSGTRSLTLPNAKMKQISPAKPGKAGGFATGARPRFVISF